jgi:predicted Zn-dependent protease with MMP-like domain
LNRGKDPFARIRRKNAAHVMKFQQLVRIAACVVDGTQRKLPKDIIEAARGVPVHYEAVPDKTVIAEGFEPDILGLFTGASHGTELDQDNPIPPQIILYINNLWDYSDGSKEIFQDEVQLTYLHELGHYLGWDEDQVASRGLD